MKKRKIPAAAVAFLLCILLVGIPAQQVWATGQEVEGTGEQADYGETSDEQGDADPDGDNSTDETEEETEYIPESFYLPIESNEIKGWPQGEKIEAEAAALMDASTGTFLYSKNMEAKEYPASTTKVMTALVALEHCSLDEEITYSEEVYNIEPGSSHLGIHPGEKMSMKDAMYGLMLASANDIAVGIAEHVAGSVEGFVQMMNDKAAQLGCTNTHFANPHGLFDENHYTCARDMALILQAAIQNPTFCEITGTVEYTIGKTNKVDEERFLLNHQKMLWDDEYKYDGCLGGKTGFVEESLNTLVTYAGKDDRKLICIILKVNGSGKTFTETAQLLDYGFGNFTNIEITEPYANLTRYELMGICNYGEVSLLMDQGLNQPAFTMEKGTVVTVPAGVGADKLKGRLDGNKLTYTYENWPVGQGELTMNPVLVEASQPQPSQTYLKYEERREKEAETESILNTAVESVQSLWDRFWDWIFDNDLMAAMIGLILIILLVPILIIGFVRNHNSQKIRKARQREKEERIKREQEIDKKTTEEIEAELRAELEADRIRREEEAAARMEQERIQKAMEEAEKLVEQKEAIEEAEKADPKEVKEMAEIKDAEESAQAPRISDKETLEFEDGTEAGAVSQADAGIGAGPEPQSGKEMDSERAAQEPDRK